MVEQKGVLTPEEAQKLQQTGLASNAWDKQRPEAYAESIDGLMAEIVVASLAIDEGGKEVREEEDAAQAQANGTQTGSTGEHFNEGWV
jgi:hypothetical protein